MKLLIVHEVVFKEDSMVLILEDNLIKEIKYAYRAIIDICYKAFTYETTKAGLYVELRHKDLIDVNFCIPKNLVSEGVEEKILMNFQG